MVDRDLAELYDVGTKRLNEAVRRNIQRFPGDFMFRLIPHETQIWHRQISRSQIATLKQGANIKYRPMVFTEHGVAMLSSVLRSDRAVAINLLIIRACIKLRELISTHAELREKLEELELKYDAQFEIIFDALQRILTALNYESPFCHCEEQSDEAISWYFRRLPRPFGARNDTILRVS